MKPQSIGRVLGTGLRIAGRMAGQRIAARAGSASSLQAAAAQVEQTRQATREAGRAAGETTRGVVRGVGGFMRPFSRVGGILWLEVTGFFFLLFAAIFATASWRTRPVTFHGPFDKPFLISAAMMALFFYLGVTSFLSAHRK
jgi:outer membrane murein-binding lipoprotein Lpp